MDAINTPAPPPAPSRGSLLFPNGAPGATPTQEPTAGSKLYSPAVPFKDTPPNAEVAALRAADPARALYKDSSGFGKDSKSADGPYVTTDPTANPLEALAVRLNPTGSTAELKTQAAQLASIAVDVGLDRNDMIKLAGLVTANTLKPLSAAEVHANEFNVLIGLQQRYGAKFTEAFSDAKKLAQRDPRLAKILDKTGAGSDPEMIYRFAELARSARAKGHLK